MDIKLENGEIAKIDGALVKTPDGYKGKVQICGDVTELFYVMVCSNSDVRQHYFKALSKYLLEIGDPMASYAVFSIAKEDSKRDKGNKEIKQESSLN